MTKNYNPFKNRRDKPDMTLKITKGGIQDTPLLVYCKVVSFEIHNEIHHMYIMYHLFLLV